MANPKLTDKSYKLTRKNAPLSLIIPTRNTKRFPLLYFDQKKGQNRSLRYASNQKSPFEDEQDNQVIVTPVVFVDGLLNVPKTNPVLQEFLHYHPQNGSVFQEINKEKDAKKELDVIMNEADALTMAKGLNLDELEMISRVLFNKDTSKTSTDELRRDVMVFAKKDPKAFLAAMNDPEKELMSKIQMFFDSKILQFRNQNKEVFFNTPTNKTRMLKIPYGEDRMHVISSYFKSNDGIEILKVLEKNLE